MVNCYKRYLADNSSRNLDCDVRFDGRLPSLSVKFVFAPAESSVFTIDSNSQITAEMKKENSMVDISQSCVTDLHIYSDYIVSLYYLY
jgi:hypothetical protein